MTSVKEAPDPSMVRDKSAIRDIRMLSVNGCALLLFLFALFWSPVVSTPAAVNQLQAYSAAPGGAEYRIQEGDQLDIKFYYNADLNEQVTVRPDGRISLQLVQEVLVAGLTVQELRQQLIRLYEKELKEPEIAVIVRSFSSLRVYVDGEVNRPGVVSLTGGMTVLQTVAQAGGMKDTANSGGVIVIRRVADGRAMPVKIDLAKAIDGTDAAQDILLMPFDIVYVPRSAIANLNLWIDQYIRRNLPIPFSLYYGFTKP